MYAGRQSPDAERLVRTFLGLAVGISASVRHEGWGCVLAGKKGERRTWLRRKKKKKN